jgi:arylsulfatase
MSHDLTRDWDALPKEERRVYARMMEIFAGFLEHTDHHIGRLLDFLEKIGELDDTLILLISDNGASAEGGPHGSVNENKFFNNVPDSLEQNLAALPDLGGPRYFNHYPWGWTWAGNTPFRRWKRETFRGGVTDPFIVHWPNGFESRGEIRHQYAHAIDLVPTVLDCLDITPPTHIRGVAQAPIEGVSGATFDAGRLDPARQYSRCSSTCHLTDGGGGLTASVSLEGKLPGALPTDRLQKLDATGWELITRRGPGGSRRRRRQSRQADRDDLAGTPKRSANVLPLDGRGTMRPPSPGLNWRSDARAAPLPGTQIVPDGQVPDPESTHSITPRSRYPRAEGVLIPQGGVDGATVASGRFITRTTVAEMSDFIGVGVEASSRYASSSSPLARRTEHGKGAPGRARLYVIEKVSAPRNSCTTIRRYGLAAGVSVGRDEGAPVE